MDRIKNKIICIITKVFGYGISVCLLAGGISFIGYIAALIIGGDPAQAICRFIYKNLYPVLVLFSTSMILLGLLKIYICGDHAAKRAGK